MEFLRAKRFAEIERTKYYTLMSRIFRNQIPSRKNGQGLEIPVSALSPQGRERYESQKRQEADWASTLVKYPGGIRRRAIRRMEILQGSSGLRGKTLREYLKSQSVGMRTFRQWASNFRARGMEGLIDDYGRPETILSQDQKDAIAVHFLQPSLPTLTYIYKTLKDVFPKNHPSYQAIRRYIAREIPQHTKILKRHGPTAFKNQCQVYAERDYETLLPNQLWCADHKQIDNAIRHPGHGALTFPWLTAIYDVRSRRILSWWLDETPSGDTFAAATRRGLMEFGRPDEFYLDNGMDFRSRHISGGQTRIKKGKVAVSEETAGLLTAMGIKIRWCQVKNPQSKPLERLFGTLQKQLSPILPGFRGGSVARRPEGLEEELKKGRLLTLQELEPLLQSWVDEYNNAPHRGRGMDGQTPNQVYATAQGKREIPNADTLTLLMMRAGRKTVRRNGIQHRGYSFYHEKLDLFLGQKVEVREDPKEAGHLAIFDPRGAFLCWAENRPLMSYKATPEEVAELKREKKRQKNNAEQFYKDVVSRAGEPDPIARLRNRPVPVAAPRGDTRPAVRLSTPIDQSAREMVISTHLPAGGIKKECRLDDGRRIKDWWEDDDDNDR